MKVDKVFMQNYRENPEKVREIFETARNTDMDRSEVATHLTYLGNDHRREESHNIIPVIGFICSTAGTLGVSEFIDTNENAKYLYIAGLITAAYFAANLAWGLFSSRNSGRIRSYSNARKDALRNIESRAQTPQ